MFSKLKFSAGIAGILFFLLTAAVTITIWALPLFAANVVLLKLDELVGLPVPVIIENYLALLRYLHLPWVNELYLPDFAVSSSGAFHFYEVKRLFMLNYAVLIGSAISSVIFWRNLRTANNEWQLIRPFQFLNWLPISIMVLLVMNFSRIFVLFHQLLFNNDDWLFNPLTDPIILVLPEQFFMQCFLLVFVLIQLGLYYILQTAKKKMNSAA